MSLAYPFLITRLEEVFFRIENIWFCVSVIIIN